MVDLNFMGETLNGPCERLIVSLLHFAEAAEAHNWGLEPQRRDQAGGLQQRSIFIAAVKLATWRNRMDWGGRGSYSAGRGRGRSASGVGVFKFKRELQPVVPRGGERLTIQGYRFCRRLSAFSCSYPWRNIDLTDESTC